MGGWGRSAVLCRGDYSKQLWAPVTKPACWPLTKDSPGWDGFSVEPKGHLGQNDSHDTGQVGLDDEIADLSLEVEMGCHDGVFTCQGAQRQTLVTRILKVLAPAPALLLKDHKGPVCRGEKPRELKLWHSSVVTAQAGP